MIRRIIGLVLITVGIAGLAICYLSARTGRDLADSVSASVDEMLETASATLTTVESSLEQAREIVEGTAETIDQVRTTTVVLALAIDDTQPTLDDLALLVGEDIPRTIDDVQNTIPNIAQTAKVVDDTLRLLSRLRVEQTVPIINYDISFGLGVDYDPEIPFDQAVEEVGRGLDPIAIASTGLEQDLRTTGANMEIVSQDLNSLASDLDNLNEEIGAFRPLLDEYSSLVDNLQDDVADGRVRLQDQLAIAKKALTVAALWLALFQLLPLYFGTELVMGNRMMREAALNSPESDEDNEESNPSRTVGHPQEPVELDQDGVDNA